MLIPCYLVLYMQSDLVLVRARRIEGLRDAVHAEGPSAVLKCVSKKCGFKRTNTSKKERGFQPALVKCPEQCENGHSSHTAHTFKKEAMLGLHH